MIRKWLKLNSSFVELLKNPATQRNLKHKWAFDYPSRQQSFCFPDNDPAPMTSSLPAPIALPPASSTSPKPILPARTSHDHRDRGDGQLRGGPPPTEECALSVTPSHTELFEVRGPMNSAFLIEVHAKDREAVKRDLIRLKGDFFHFDRCVLEWFTLKCILSAEPFAGFGKDQMRLAKVHAISSGCEEVYVVEGIEKFFFVITVDNMMRSKKILEKLGYKISEILYRFQAKEKIPLEDRYRGLCLQFAGAVEQLPKIISVTHNLCV